MNWNLHSLIALSIGMIFSIDAARPSPNSVLNSSSSTNIQVDISKHPACSSVLSPPLLFTRQEDCQSGYQWYLYVSLVHFRWVSAEPRAVSRARKLKFSIFFLYSLAQLPRECVKQQGTFNVPIPMVIYPITTNILAYSLKYLPATNTHLHWQHQRHPQQQTQSPGYTHPLSQC